MFSSVSVVEKNILKHSCAIQKMQKVLLKPLPNKMQFKIRFQTKFEKTYLKMFTHFYVLSTKCST